MSNPKPHIRSLKMGVGELLDIIIISSHCFKHCKQRHGHQIYIKIRVLTFELRNLNTFNYIDNFIIPALFFFTF